MYRNWTVFSKNFFEILTNCKRPLSKYFVETFYDNKHLKLRLEKQNDRRFTELKVRQKPINKELSCEPQFICVRTVETSKKKQYKQTIMRLS